MDPKMDVLYELIWKDEFGMTCKFIWGGEGQRDLIGKCSNYPLGT